MGTECEAERVIKQVIHKIEVDMGNGVFNFAGVLAILRRHAVEQQREGVSEH